MVDIEVSVSELSHPFSQISLLNKNNFAARAGVIWTRAGNAFYYF